MGRKAVEVYKLALLLIVVNVMLSCNKDLPLPDVKGEKKIVLLGELVAGDTFLFRIGQSVAITKNGQQQFELLRNATITLSDSSGASYVMTGNEDDFSAILYTVPFSLNKVVAAGNSYTVVAKSPSLGTATANVHIPGPINAVVRDTVTTIYNSDNALAIKIMIKDPPGSPN